MCPTVERTDWMHQQSTMSSLKIVIVVRRGLVKTVLETLGLWCPTVVGNSLQSCMRGWGTFRDWSSVGINKRRNSTIVCGQVLMCMLWSCFYVDVTVIVWVSQCRQLALFPGLPTIHFLIAYNIHTSGLWWIRVHTVYTYRYAYCEWSKTGQWEELGTRVVADAM